MIYVLLGKKVKYGVDAFKGTRRP